MAGNTRLIGFGADINNPGKYVLKLARWGKETIMEVSKESFQRIQLACSAELPLKPHQSSYIGPDFRAEYNTSHGSVNASLSLETTEWLSGVLDAWVDDWIGDLGKDDERIKEAQAYSENLKGCIQDHENFHNKMGEPGVEDTP